MAARACCIPVDDMVCGMVAPSSAAFLSSPDWLLRYGRPNAPPSLPNDADALPFILSLIL